MIVIPKEKIEQEKGNLNVSLDEDGNPTHWHIVFFKDVNGKVTWFISKPELHEIDITDYLLN